MAVTFQWPFMALGKAFGLWHGLYGYFLNFPHNLQGKGAPLKMEGDSGVGELRLRFTTLFNVQCFGKEWNAEFILFVLAFLA